MNESAAAATSEEVSALKALQDIRHNRINRRKRRFMSLIVKHTQVAYQER
jgi:hypothetical protein